MPNTTWTLQVHCQNCGADTTFTSELGENFKLSHARKEADLYRRAQNWVDRYGLTGHPEGVPANLEKHIVRFHTVSDAKTYILGPVPKFYYVKCPVCQQRVYVC